ncbi:MAG TPA: penicillin acylase family protein [Gemmataceae bacterium]|nr:penicillin acylase family protein [Gemmataceae bacterium]
MNLPRWLLGVLLGRRLPRTSGTIEVAGLRQGIRIGRDAWGIPHIEAKNESDGWFGLGFCHGQDRAFQLESLLRVCRGTFAEILGPRAVPVDRLSRRIGFHHSAKKQWPVLSNSAREILMAYSAGVTMGITRGSTRKAHEFALLGCEPTPWEGVDILAFVKLMSFTLASNWDAELNRLRMLTADGPEAVRALDPLAHPDLQISAGSAIERLEADLQAFSHAMPLGAASNNWVIAGNRTRSGRPLLANDPHLFPALPSQWYLAHVRTPEFEVAGVTMVGSPAFAAGHNGFAAWGATAGMVDQVDLFLEEIGPDEKSLRRGKDFAPCEVRMEAIVVKGGETVHEPVLETPRGPIITPIFAGEGPHLSFRAVWLDPLPVRGLLEAHKSRSFEQFRDCFREWPVLPLNFVYADVTGKIGWQLTGQAPKRKRGWGTLPQPGWDPDCGWEKDLVPFEQMPHGEDGHSGYFATANNPPPAGSGDGYVGVDFLDPYRAHSIRLALDERRDWDVESCQKLHLNVNSLTWSEIRSVVLSIPVGSEETRLGINLLRDWDGRVSADSPAAAVFEFFVAEMLLRMTKAKAPNSYCWALGEKACNPGLNLFNSRRLQHLVRQLNDQPSGWFARSWIEEMADALTAAVRKLRERFGPSPGDWPWGRVRKLRLRNPILQDVPILKWIFNEGPIAWGGDADTIGQAAVVWLDPTADTDCIAGTRMVVDVGNWSASRFVLVGGQSSNPLSPHFLDMFPLWQRGDGVPIAWTEEEVRAAVREEMELRVGV